VSQGNFRPAKIMLDLSREEDLCFRYGCEEFGFIVKGTDIEMLNDIAERLRTTVEQSQSPTGKPITISLGVAIYPNMEKKLNSLSPMPIKLYLNQ
jgi:diguanylate cyclase (GGDEF)-like protein